MVTFINTRMTLNRDKLLIENLRERRQRECFDICDRACWYDSLTDKQKEDVKKWRAAWLDVTKTLEIPQKPEWLED